MTLVADADVPDPIVTALQAVHLDIKRLSEIGAPSSPDKAVMDAILQMGGILMTMDLVPITSLSL